MNRQIVFETGAGVGQRPSGKSREKGDSCMYRPNWLHSRSARTAAFCLLAAAAALGPLACNMEAGVSTSQIQPEIARAVKNVYPALVRIYVVIDQPSGG